MIMISPSSKPRPLRGLDAGTFTEYTVKERFLGIVQRVLAENRLSETAVQHINTLLAEIPEGKIRPLTDSDAPDFEGWQEAIESYLEQNWLEVPWFFVETYLFRRIIEAVDYFRTGLDPFQFQKQESLRVMLDKVVMETAVLQKMIDDGQKPDHLEWLLLRDLWGNQVDLGLWSADDAFEHLHTARKAQLSHLLVNDMAEAIPKIAQASRIDFIIDNSGYELVGDFLLAAYLLASSPSLTIHFHLKRHPTFVSDVTMADIEYALKIFKEHPHLRLQSFGQQLATWMENGRLNCHHHLFWTSPYPMWNMPHELAEQLAQADLIISKGDANYRRALGDLHWPYETPIDEIVTYLKSDALFLRTCKSELLAGLPNGRSDQLRQQDPTWDVNGKWGVIQLV